MEKLNNTITYLFTPLSNAHWNVLEKSMNEIGLHSGQVFLLISLFGQDGQSQIELATNLGIAPPTVNKMVKNLVINELIKTERDKIDTRIVKVFLEPKGQKYRDLIQEKWSEIETKILTDFTETEKLILIQLFNKMLGNLKK